MPARHAYTDTDTILGAERVLAPKVYDMSHRNRVGGIDDFMVQSLLDTSTPWILNSGSDDVAADPAVTSPLEAGGVIQLVSGDAGTGVAADGSQLVYAFPMQADDGGGLVGEAKLKIVSAVTNCQVNVGFTDSTSLELPVSIGGSDALTTTASDFAGFVYDTGADTDQWFGVAVDSNTDDTSSATTGVAPTADTYQILRVEVSADGTVVRFLIDGIERLKLNPGSAGVSPDVNLYFTIIVNSTTTTSKTVKVDWAGPVQPGLSR